MNIAVICARGGSKRFPDKHLQIIRGKHLIAYSILLAKKSKLLDRIIVSTDSEQIARVAEEYGAEVIKRPASLAGDASAIDDAYRHAVHEIEKSGKKVEILVCMQGNCIVLEPVDIIDRCISKLIKENAESVVTLIEVKEHPFWTKIIRDNRVVPFYPTDIYINQDLPKMYRLDGSVDAIRRDVLMNPKNRGGLHKYLGTNMQGILIKENKSVEIDTMSDFKLANMFLN